MVEEFRLLLFLVRVWLSMSVFWPLKITAIGNILLGNEFHFLVPPSQKMSSPAESLQVGSIKFTLGSEGGENSIFSP